MGRQRANLYNYTDGMGNTYEGFLPTSEGLGLRFTAADVTWLTNSSNGYCCGLVPEPTLILLMCLGGLAMLWQAKRARCTAA